MPRELGAVRVRGIRSGVREVLARHPRYRGAPDAPVAETRVARPACPEALLRLEYSARRAIVPKTPRLRVRMTRREPVAHHAPRPVAHRTPLPPQGISAKRSRKR